MEVNRRQATLAMQREEDGGSSTQLAELSSAKVWDAHGARDISTRRLGFRSKTSGHDINASSIHQGWRTPRLPHSKTRRPSSNASSRPSANDNDLVLDCFCGSGTTAAVAEKLGRRWIACDLGRFAIHTTRKRLLCIDNVRPFVVQNLGKYERQLWQAGEFGEATAKQAAEQPARPPTAEFILDTYHAAPLQGYTWLHGVKNGRLVHVGGVDAPVARRRRHPIAAEFAMAMGSGPNAPRPERRGRARLGLRL